MLKLLIMANTTDANSGPASTGAGEVIDVRVDLDNFLACADGGVCDEYRTAVETPIEDPGPAGGRPTGFTEESVK